MNSSEGIFAVINPVVAYLNNIISHIVPGGEVYVVALIALGIAYSIKYKNNWNNGMMIIAALVIFTSMQYLGIGVIS